ncbi:MAG: EAL domain-containing protein, partial [Pseudomonadota bacterium]
SLLRAESDRFAELTRSIPGVVYQRVVRTNGEIRYTYISETASEFFGVPAKKIIEDPTALFDSYSAEYRESFRKRLLEASKTLTTWDVEAQINMPDGSRKFTHAIARPKKQADGSVLWTGVILDASRIKEAEREAARTEARTRKAIVESIAHGFLMFDPEDKLVLSNTHFRALYPDLKQVARAGASYRDVIAAELQLEKHEARSDHALRARVQERMDLHNDGSDFVLERRIGSHTWVQINEHRTHDNNTVVVYTDVSEMRRREERMHHMALHDALTNLPNRTLFRDRLEKATVDAVRYGGQVAVVCIDLDNFKHVNDTLGHPAGDKLLCEAVDRIRGCIRETDTLARLGGDEFALIVPELGDIKDVDSVAVRIIEEVSKPFVLDGQQASVGASIGIAISEVDALDPDILIKNADLALYRAKADNKNCHRFFKAEMDDKAQARRMLELELRGALERDELILHFQPQIDAGSFQIKGFEALVRWQHPERGLISPAGFIEVAEETGIIIPLGNWVVERACAIAASWTRPAIVAVNVSPAQLKRTEFVDVVRRTLERTGLAPERLELEITETVFLRDTKQSLAILSELKALGCRIAMDDFGTGYSSLGNLRRFPFDKIKIDRSFVADLENSSEAAAIVKAVVSMGKTLAIETTAEGVETVDQVMHLEKEGCSQLQGFFYSKPRPADEVLTMLEEHQGPIEFRAYRQGSADDGAALAADT